jgi:adenylosuccinate synthase
MSESVVVIGANFGDEGKGLITDYLASTGKYSLNVRFNGGAQAAHTVIDEKGRRIVFHHFGSGTVSGLETLLSKHFIINPILFKIEQKELNEAGYYKKIFADSKCLVTTPYDMLLNQIAEESRDSVSKHGSCGLGINETFLRDAVINLRLKDLHDENKLRSILEFIRHQYISIRLNQLNIEKIDVKYIKLFNSESVFKNFIEDCKIFRHFSYSIEEPKDVFEHRNGLLFEGAQGLLLDERRKDLMPYITRSKTGIYNVTEIYDKDVEKVYVTRAYLTRHGAGPLPWSGTVAFNDETNVYNKFQGNIRFAPFNFDLTKDSILRDLKDARSSDFSLAITCLDQIDSTVKYVENDKILETSKENFIEKIRKDFAPTKMYLSFGPTKNTVKIF